MAIAIPVFTSQLEKSRESTDVANVRSAYAVVVSEALTQATPAEITSTIELKQQQDGWQGADPTDTLAQLGASFTGVEEEPAEVTVTGTPSAGGTATITWTPAIAEDDEAAVEIAFE